MHKIKVIIAESSDIMLNGLTDLLEKKNGMQVIKKADSYDALCRVIENQYKDVVVVGPLINSKYQCRLGRKVLQQFPFVKIVEIEFHDDRETIVRKIKETAEKLAC